MASDCQPIAIGFFTLRCALLPSHGCGPMAPYTPTGSGKVRSRVMYNSAARPGVIGRLMSIPRVNKRRCQFPEDFIRPLFTGWRTRPPEGSKQALS